MNRVLKHRNRQQQDRPNFRSVGSKAYDFNRLKYTTSYRAFGRKSSPILDHPETPENQKQIINLNLKLNLDKEKQKEQKSPKKPIVIIDKWKQRYQKIEFKLYSRRKSHDHLPTLSKHGLPLVMISTKDKFHINKNMSENKLGRKTLTDKRQFARNMDLVKQIFQKYPQQEAFQKYQKQPEYNQDTKNLHQQIFERKLKYALSLNQKIDSILKIKKKSLTNMQSLKPVEEMPERWQITLQDQWN